MIIKTIPDFFIVLCTPFNLSVVETSKKLECVDASILYKSCSEYTTRYFTANQDNRIKENFELMICYR